MKERRWLRALAVVVMAASVLVPTWISPARAIEIPTTMAGTLTFAAPGGFRRAMDDPIHSATFEFPATHIGFAWTGDEGTRVRYRTADAEGPFGRWMRAPVDHDAGSATQHFSAVLEIQRADRLQWRPVVPSGKEMGAVTLDYLNTLDGPTKTVVLPATAEAAARTPNIVTRAEWGADESVKHTSGGCQRVFNPVQQLFVHHTAGTNFDTHPKATMRAIYWFHVVRRGWCDIGYNFVIAPNGTIFEARWARNYRPFEIHDSENGRDEGVTGAHVEGFNSGSIGISLMGNYSLVSPSPAMRRSLAELLAWEADRHNLDPKARHRYRNPESGLRRRLPTIAGHRDAGETECPGNYMYAALPAVRRDTAAVIGGGKLESEVVLQAVTNPASYGDQASFSGVLKSGVSGLAGRTIITYVREVGGQWKAGPTTTTSLDGSFGLSFTAVRNLSIVAIYDGEKSIWGSESNTVQLRVAPDIEIHTEGGTMDETGVAHYPAGTTSVPLAGSVVPTHAGWLVVVKVERLQPDGTYLMIDRTEVSIAKGGMFSHNFLPPDTAGGTFQAIARFMSDDDHSTSTSAPALFYIDAL
jgi:hypothetical protein